MKSFFTRNAIIVMLNILAGCILLFCCTFYFFQSMRLFYKDITSWMFFAPLVLGFGTAFVCFYIIYLVSHLEADTMHNADRFDLAYRIVFTITVIMLFVRSFLGDFTVPRGHEDELVGMVLQATIPLNVAGIISGLITWFTPKIKDNDNKDF